MPDLENIIWECGNSYITKSVISSCPNCGKTNYGQNAGLLFYAIVIGLVIFVGYIFGPFAYAWYSKNLKKFHAVLATISAPVVFLLGTAIFFTDGNSDWIVLVSLVVNFAALLLGIARIIQPRDNSKLPWKIQLLLH